MSYSQHNQNNHENEFQNQNFEDSQHFQQNMGNESHINNAQAQNFGSTGQAQQGFQERFETDPDFMDQSSQDLGTFDITNQDKQNRETIGFKQKFDTMSKLNSDQNSVIQMKIQSGQLSSLDQKANMIVHYKTLSNYYSKNEVVLKIDEGEPLQMIYIDESTQKWVLNQRVVQELQEVKGPISFISIIGKPQTGKTFLMNHLIQKSMDSDSEKFRTGDSPHNKGLIIWSKPMYNPSTGSSMFFIDTQEYGEEQIRSEIQQIQTIITLLISSLVILNVQGDLNHSGLSPLVDIHDIQNYIDLDLDMEKREMINFNVRQELQVLFPKLIFVMRDFKDQVKKNGKNISFQQYLSNFLEDDETFIKATENEKKVRRRIIKYFKTRDAHSLVPPLTNNQNIADLDRVQQFELDVKFQEGLKILRKKIIQHQCKKELRGVQFNSTMMISFINSILEDINNEGKINLIQCHAILLENEYISAYNDSVEVYNFQLQERFKDENYKSFVDLINILKQSREASMENFHKLKISETDQSLQYRDEYQRRLVEMIDQKEQLLIKFNNDLQNKMLQDIAKQSQLNNNQKKEQNIQSITKNYNILLKKVMKDCLGNAEEEHLNKFTDFVMDEVTQAMVQQYEQQKKQIQDKEVIIHEFKQKIAEQNKQHDEEKKKNKEVNEQEVKKLKNQHQELEKKIQDVNKDKEKQEKQKQELETELNKIKIELDEEKKKKQACCNIY